MLNDNSKSSEVLAVWNYQPDLWRDFLIYESRIYKGSVREAKRHFFITPILTFGTLILIPIIAFLAIDYFHALILTLLCPIFGGGLLGYLGFAG